MQCHVNGGASVWAIDALVAMTGNVGKEGGGARYGHLMTWGHSTTHGGGGGGGGGGGQGG